MTYPDTQLFIGGTWRPAASKRALAVVNPATGQKIGTVAHASTEDLEAAVAAAVTGFATWRDMSPFKRQGILRDASANLRADADRIAVLMTMEQGKPLAESRGEILKACSLLDWFADEGCRVYGRVVAARGDLSIRQMVVRDPVGPVAAFTPWNFPINQIARKVGPAILDSRPVGAWDRLKYALGNTLIYGPLKDTLGFGRVRVGYTAGEAIGPEIFDFYRSLGINLKQLYGQTEASVFITLQPDGEVRSDTVGVAAPGVEIRIAENGEVYYRGPGVFEEYYKNPESTASTKDAEGWVATGDAGFFDKENGHLRIIDRAKDVGKMADGRLFAPKYVENKLKYFPNILEAVVFGNDRDKCTAFINIDLNAVGNWAERNNIGYASYQELAGHPQVLETMRAHVEEVNRSLASDPMLAHCQVHRFIVLHKELDPDDGEITRTRKVRRGVISEKYADLLNALYDGSTEISTRTEVTYEDGRKGYINATLKVCEADMVPVEAPEQVAAE